jgi:hypothetical protein
VIIFILAVAPHHDHETFLLKISAVSFSAAEIENDEPSNKYSAPAETEAEGLRILRHLDTIRIGDHNSFLREPVKQYWGDFVVGPPSNRARDTV